MVSVTYIRCPGCHALIRLRLGYGSDEVQPFFIPCEACGAITKGYLRIDFGESPKVSLHMEAGERLEGSPSERVSQNVTIHPDFPSVADAGSFIDVGGSPFMLFGSIIPGFLQEFQSRLGHYRKFALHAGPSIKRIHQYYLDENVMQMVACIQRDHPSLEIDPKTISVGPSPVLTLYERLFSSLCLVPHYESMKDDWTACWKGSGSTQQAMRQYAAMCISDAKFKSTARHLSECLTAYIDLRSAVLPGFAMDVIREHGLIGHPEVRLLRDDFAPLRALYQDSFETCHHVLRYLVGVINAHERGDPNEFNPGLSEHDAPNNLNRFAKLPNAYKPQWIADFEMWADFWVAMLDRNLRNAIGHKSIRHDLRSGTLVWDKGPPIKYTDFARTVFLLVYPLLLCLLVMTTIQSEGTAWVRGSDLD